MYRTLSTLRRKLRIRYPMMAGRVVLRTELDWNTDLEAESVTDDGMTYTFALEAAKPFLYFKPCLRRGEKLHWSVGANMLVLMTSPGTRDVYPFFEEPDSGAFTEALEVRSDVLHRTQ